MLREISVFGALMPSLLLYFLTAIPLFLVIDRVASPLGLYRLVWHPPLVRVALFVCVFSALVLSTAP
jgi:protein AaeX